MQFSRIRLALAMIAVSAMVGGDACVSAAPPAATSPGLAPTAAPSPRTAPAGTVSVAGGVVTMGPYESDPAEWGTHEVYLAPYFIDRVAKAGLGGAACSDRGGHLATEAELEHALRTGVAQASTVPERTGSAAIPDDATQLASTEGVGFYDVLLSGASRVVLRGPTPDPAPDSPARCVIPASTVADPPMRATRMLTLARRSRGEAAPFALGFRALGDKKAGEQRKLPAGTLVLVLHQEADWAFIQLAKGPDEPLGWVPVSALIPVHPKR